MDNNKDSNTIPSASTRIAGNNGGATFNFTGDSSSNSCSLELDPNLILENFVIWDDEGNSSSSSGSGRPHVCSTCGSSYKTRTHLRRHMMIHREQRPFVCPHSECGRGFNRKEHMTKHLQAVHSGTKHKCPFCTKEISRRDHLSRHIKHMHPEGEEGVARINNVVDLDDEEQPPPTKRLKENRSPGSSSCNSSISSTLTDLNSDSGGQSKGSSGGRLLGGGEANNISPTEKLPAEDKVPLIGSGETVPVPNTNTAHIFMDSETFQQFQQFGVGGMDPISTNIIFTEGTGLMIPSTSSSSLIELQNKPQPEGTRIVNLDNFNLTEGGIIVPQKKPEQEAGQGLPQNLKCDQCPAVMSNEKDFVTHKKSHKPQYHQCDECPRAYSRREKLVEHVRCHHEGKKFVCEHCGKVLARKDHVLRHVRSTHPEMIASRLNVIAEVHENVLTPVSLTLEEHPQPEKTSTDPSSSRAERSSVNEVSSLLRSICQYCLRVFGTTYHLARHIKSCHSGNLRPYTCTACSKQFKRKDHLASHIKLHCAARKTNVILQKAEHEDKVETSVPNNNSLEQQSTELDTSPSDLNLALASPFITENGGSGIDVDLGNASHHHPHPPESSTFPCGYCQKEFPTRDQLLDHLQDHSGNDIVMVNITNNRIHFLDF